MKPLLINNLEFAKKNQEISGQIAIASCKRLAELISSSEGHVTDIRYRLTGSAKKMSLPSLFLQIEAQLPLLCQRCLEEIELNFALEFNYLITNKEISEIEENDDIDWLEASQEMDLIELIEDELLTAMPIAPMHETACSQTSLQSGKKLNPFAILKGRFK